MYTLIINHYPSRTSQLITFNNLRDALNSFIERCDAHDLQYKEDNLGNFYSESHCRDYEFQLLSTF